MTKIKKQDDDISPEMKLFKCITCGDTYPDCKLYFYDTPSKRCTWCMKNPDRLKKKRTFK